MDAKQDQDVSEVVEDGEGEDVATECDGSHVQGEERTEGDRRGGSRRREASVGSSEDGQTRRRAAHKSGKEHADSTAPLKCAFFSSFFYAILRNAKNGYNFDNVRRWSRNKVWGCVHAGEHVCTC